MYMIERKAFIFNVQKYNTYDGPGVRTMVFFKGCPLRCKWCSNPEGLEAKYSVMYKESSCNHCGCCVKVCPKAIHQMVGGEHQVNKTYISGGFSPTTDVWLPLSRDLGALPPPVEVGGLEHVSHQVNRAISCIGCRECEKSCPRAAIAIFGEEKTISQLLDTIEEDRIFYDVSGGGVTLSGGDVVTQPEAGANLLLACKEHGFNTAVETSGYGKGSTLLKLAEFTDLFLYDIKLMDSKKHYHYTGVNNESILENFATLIKNRYNVLVRVPLLKGINDHRENTLQLADFLTPFIEYKNFKGVELLPYHKFSLGKYPALGMEYTLDGDYTMSERDLLRVELLLKGKGIKVKILRH
jgi:pyruvate formate lyase activating enzyme